LLHQENLLQYATTTLAPICHYFIIKLNFKLKRSWNNNVTKVGALVENLTNSNQQSGSQKLERVSP